MQYRSFHIKNFKGIRDQKIQLSQRPNQIYTLIGLNESGKTSILEALSLFQQTVRGTADSYFDIGGRALADVLIIPKDLQANFNGKIVVEAEISLDPAAKQEIEEICKRDGFTRVKVPETGTVASQTLYRDSTRVSTTRIISLNVEVAKKNERKLYALSGSEQTWKDYVAALLARLPPIIYYPNFLFDLPERIYLESHPVPDMERTQAFFRSMLQDVLDYLKLDLELQTHIVQRLRSGDPSDKPKVQSVIDKMSSAVSDVIFETGKDIFGRRTADRYLQLNFPELDPGIDRYYLAIRYKQGTDSYSVSDRSLGFRWFFTFLMLILFRIHRSEEATGKIFVLDEPASNLHPTAQTQLLEVMASIVQDSGSSIIYTTHSHYLISPLWLDTAFVVQNEAIDYGSAASFEERPTTVIVSSYRHFAGQNPTKRTYFQPVLDLLEYRPSNFDPIRDVVMVEGKKDYYGLRYIFEILLQCDDMQLLPGAGASSLLPPIQMYVAWGKSFLVLLDSDKAGDQSRKYYEKQLESLVHERILTYGDIEPAWRGLAFEKVLGEDDALTLQQAVFPDATTLDKETLALALQELLKRKLVVRISDRTLGRFRMVAAELKKRL